MNKDGLTLPDGKEELFMQFYSDVAEYNEKVNITAITKREEFFLKHISDSLAGEKFFPPSSRVAEVGSGGGFPSFPLKISRPDLSFTLFESVGKKCAFLSSEAAKLGFENVEVVNCRAEDAGRNSKYREKFDVCCARAVARLNTLLEYCAPLVKKGGIFIAYKGSAEEEIKEAERAACLLGMEKQREEKYELPCGAGARTLVIYKKIKPTPDKYPRGNGKERKNPL